MEQVIRYFLGNLGLMMFILALLIIIAQYQFSTLLLAELTFRWIALLPLGITGLYTFVMHAFFGNFTAATIGWANSPFQYEVAMANLAVGLIGILAFKASLGFRKAVTIAAICWLWGDGTGHIYQMITTHNFTAGNAGSWFWLDILVPLTLLICLLKLCHIQKNTIKQA
jgi:hypothetical protein